MVKNLRADFIPNIAMGFFVMNEMKVKPIAKQIIYLFIQLILLSSFSYEY